MQNLILNYYNLSNEKYRKKSLFKVISKNEKINKFIKGG